MCQEVEAVLTGKDEIALEESLLFGLDVLAAVGYVLLGQTEINHPYLVEEVFVASDRLWETDHDVVQLHVVVGVASLVDELDLAKHL